MSGSILVNQAMVGSALFRGFVAALWLGSCCTVVVSFAVGPALHHHRSSSNLIGPQQTPLLLLGSTTTDQAEATSPVAEIEDHTRAPGLRKRLGKKLMSKVILLATRATLKSCSDLSCEVSSTPRDLLRGKMGPVKMKAKDVVSRNGLSCHAIESSSDLVHFNVRQVLSRKRRMIVTNTVHGKIMVAMTAQDLGKFLVHPSMQQAKIRASKSDGGIMARVHFSQDGIVIDPKAGTVTCYATYGGTSWQCVLKQDPSNAAGKNKGIVNAAPLQESADHDEEESKRLSKVLTKFFNELVLEPDTGLYLSARGMAVTGKGKSPTILFALNSRMESQYNAHLV